MTNFKLLAGSASVIVMVLGSATVHAASKAAIAPGDSIEIYCDANGTPAYFPQQCSVSYDSTTKKYSIAMKSFTSRTESTTVPVGTAAGFTQAFAQAAQLCPPNADTAYQLPTCAVDTVTKGSTVTNTVYLVDPKDGRKDIYIGGYSADVLKKAKASGICRPDTVTYPSNNAGAGNGNATNVK